MIQFTLLHPRMSFEDLGELPYFLSPNADTSAAQQFDANYPFGGWQPMTGWSSFNPETGALRYPGDPTMKPIATAVLRNERIWVYESAWVCVAQPDGAYSVARID